MNKTTEKFLNFLTELNNNPEKLDAFWNEITENLEKKKEKALLFGQTPEYKIALQKLSKYLDENSHASYDEYKEFVTPEIDNDTFFALHDYAFVVEKITEIVDTFPTDYVFHAGICFSKTYGQGTHYSACKYPNNTYVFFGESPNEYNC